MAPTKTTKKVPAKKVEEKHSLEISMFDLAGKENKKITLSEDIFGVKVNKALLAQYVRVYQINQRQGNANAKTRSEIVGSTKKIYRQKGTGNARHGSNKAPIFVGGGVAGGPRTKDYSKTMNKKQKKLALFSSLAWKAQENSISAIVNDVLDMSPKTKDFKNFLSNAQIDSKKVLIVLPEVKKNGLVLAARNLPSIEIVQAANLNPYMVLNSRKIVFVEDALATLETHFIKNNAN